MKTYLEESARTVAGKFHADLITQEDAKHFIGGVIEASKGLDRIKKALFYGKAPPWPIPPMNRDPVQTDSPNTLHAILGIATEAAELLELVEDVHNRKKLVDEAGDVLWYLALLFRELDITFEEVAALNLAKLKVRFPEKFEESRAIHRDDVQESLVF